MLQLSVARHLIRVVAVISLIVGLGVLALTLVSGFVGIGFAVESAMEDGEMGNVVLVIISVTILAIIAWVFGQWLIDLDKKHEEYAVGRTPGHERGTDQAD